MDGVGDACGDFNTGLLQIYGCIESPFVAIWYRGTERGMLITITYLFPCLRVYLVVYDYAVAVGFNSSQ